MCGLQNGKADLHMSVIGSSIALLSGQKPPFRLLVRAVRSSSHTKASHIRHAVSDAFVVSLCFGKIKQNRCV